MLDTPNKLKAQAKEKGVAEGRATGEDVHDISSPFIFIYSAPPNHGKTHFALTHADAFCDFEGKSDSALKNVAKGTRPEDILIPASWDDVVDWVGDIYKSDDISTIAFDTVDMFYAFAEIQTMEDLNKSSLFSKKAGSVMYAKVYDRMRWLIRQIRSKGGKNILFTAHVKDEYKGNEKTGRKIPAIQYKLFNWAKYVVQAVDNIIWEVDSPDDQQDFIRYFKVHKNADMHPHFRPDYAVCDSDDYKPDLDEFFKQFGMRNDEKFWSYLQDKVSK